MQAAFGSETHLFYQRTRDRISVGNKSRAPYDNGLKTNQMTKAQMAAPIKQAGSSHQPDGSRR
jgi:hypothetical protein